MLKCRMESEGIGVDTELLRMDAELEHIYISDGHDYWGRRGEGRLQNGIRECETVECVEGKGLVGDRYFGYRENFRGQVTFFELETVEAIRERFRLPRLPASVFRRNLVVSGVRLKDFHGKRFIFRGIAFEGCQECKPCHWMDRVVDAGTEEFMKPDFRGGLRAKILRSGILKKG